MGSERSLGGGLVTRFFVHYVVQRIALLKTPELLDEKIHRSFEPIRRVIGTMRGQ